MTFLALFFLLYSFKISHQLFCYDLFIEAKDLKTRPQTSDYSKHFAYCGNINAMCIKKVPLSAVEGSTCYTCDYSGLVCSSEGISNGESKTLENSVMYCCNDKDFCNLGTGILGCLTIIVVILAFF